MDDDGKEKRIADEMNNDEKEKKNFTKSEDVLEDGNEEKEGIGEVESEQSTTTNYVRRRSFKKPKGFFYIGGSNGAHLVEENLLALGWERITDKSREDFKLKWCEIKSHNNYHSFREGEQLCYQIPNNKLLTTKIGLLISLQEYERVMNKVKKGKPRIMKYQDFFPETYRLDVKDDRELFFESYVDNEVWISKPTGLNQGKGIYLIRNREEIQKLQEKIAEISEDMQSSKKLPFKVPMARIVQRYVENPLLLEGKKFDVRNYLLIACTNPLVVFYADGYCRLTCMPYDRNSTDLTGHLTNQYMQKKNPLYEEMKEDTVWSMDRFNDFVNDNFSASKNLPEDWVHTVLRKRCQQIMLHCFQAVRHKLECRLGFFDLIGCDFLVDEDFKISLLEMNCNPALHTNCDALKEIMPDIVGETLKLALEIFDKAIKRERIMPLAAQRNFVLLYNGDAIEAAERRERLQSAAEARRRARSAQRRKKFNPGQFVYKRTVNNTTTATVTTTTTSASSGSQLTSTSLSHNTSPPSNQTLELPSMMMSPTTSSVSSTVTTVSTFRLTDLPSSTVTALTMSSQQRVAKPKGKLNNDLLKPFYAGGTVTTSRPFSAPKVKRKYAQVESKVMSHNNLYSMESPRRDNMNNAALNAASNSKIVNYAQKAKSVLLTPKREDITDLKDLEGEDPVTTHPEDDPTNDMKEEIDVYDRENLFERILEEVDEMEIEEDDEDEEDEELMNIKNSSSPDMIRRPSAKLPSNYHTSFLQNNFISGASSWPRYPNPSQSIQKKITRIASLSVRGHMDLPLPAVSTTQHTLKPSYDHSINKMQYRAPTTVRIRQSLPATTCTLEIGPKSRRGLIAVSTGKLITPNSNETYTMNRKLHNTARLKLINSSHNVAVNPDSNNEFLPPSALVYLATNHLSTPSEQDSSGVYIGGGVPGTGSLVHGAVSMQYTTAQTSNQFHIKHVQVNNVKLKSDSSTQTLRRSNPSLTGEEKVIWRLRSRICDPSLRFPSDGFSTPVSQINSKKQKVPIKVVTQSPGLISPRRPPDSLVNRSRVVPVHKKTLINNNNSACLGATINPSKSQKIFIDPPTSSSEGESGSSINVDLTSCVSSSEKRSALSKVVAIATAVPTHVRPSEGKVKGSNGFNEEPTLLTAG